jgi:hypothetical protein
VGISRDYPLKTRTSKQSTGEIPGYKLIPSHPLKYPRSKQGLKVEKITPHYPILFNTTLSPPLHAPPLDSASSRNPSSLSDCVAHPGPAAAVLCCSQPWTTTTGPPPLTSSSGRRLLPTFRAQGAAVDLRRQVLPLVTDGPCVYFLHFGRWQAGRSSAHHHPSAPPPPQLA